MKFSGDIDQHFQVREIPVILPVGYRLPGDVQLIREFILREAVPFSQFFDLVSEFHVFSPLRSEFSSAAHDLQESRAFLMISGRQRFFPSPYVLENAGFQR